MPYAQQHYPFEHREDFGEVFPADFIAEGVDQTRGWFFTLHAIAAMLFDSVAFKNIISNGLVLDKNGNKMSKRLGNAVDPFEVLDSYGADATRWYMISNSQPWDNLKFDRDGVDEVRRKFFGTLYNTYSFFALYANVDGFTGREAEVPVARRPEIDRWISFAAQYAGGRRHGVARRLRSDPCGPHDPGVRVRKPLQLVRASEPQTFLGRRDDRGQAGGLPDALHLSGNRRIAQRTLRALHLGAHLPRPERRERPPRRFGASGAVPRGRSVACGQGAGRDDVALAQRVSSMVLALRRKVNIKVRQPLGKILIPVLDPAMGRHIEAVRPLIMNEVNVKRIELVAETAGLITKRIKPNFKTLGPKYGKYMKQIAALTAAFTQEQIAAVESAPETTLDLGGERITVTAADFEITSEDMPGWLVTSEGKLTVALDITVTDDLRREGVARELINRIQNIRKDSGFEVTDRIRVEIEAKEAVVGAVAAYADYIGQQTLAARHPHGGPSRRGVRRGLGDRRGAVENCRDEALNAVMQRLTTVGSRGMPAVVRYRRRIFAKIFCSYRNKCYFYVTR